MTESKEYKIYQLKEIDALRELRYADYELLVKFGKEINIENYDEVYAGEIASTTNETALEELFVLFNTNRPKDFKSRSVSVSDIILLDSKHYYCDSFSFKEVSI